VVTAAKTVYAVVGDTGGAAVFGIGDRESVWVEKKAVSYVKGLEHMLLI